MRIYKKNTSLGICKKNTSFEIWPPTTDCYFSNPKLYPFNGIIATTSREKFLNLHMLRDFGGCSIFLQCVHKSVVQGLVLCVAPVMTSLLWIINEISLFLKNKEGELFCWSKFFRTYFFLSDEFLLGRMRRFELSGSTERGVGSWVQLDVESVLFSIGHRWSMVAEKWIVIRSELNSIEVFLSYFSPRVLFFSLSLSENYWYLLKIISTAWEISI